MSTKQLYEKTSEGMKEVNPLVAIEDIYSKLSDTPLEALVSLYNHVKCEWKGSVADTRRTVPLFLRRSGLFITYNNGTKFITEFFSAGVEQITTEGWVKDSNWTPVPDEDYISAGVKPGVGSIGYEQLNDNLKQLFREKVNVTNYPDDEDIASVDNMLKLKDREVDVANFQSKGYVILRKNLRLVNGVVKNILTQDMINRPNTIYEIRYDFDLNDNIITLNNGCSLKFCEGSLNNGIINCSTTIIDSKPINIFYNVILQGSIIGDVIINWFNHSSDCVKSMYNLSCAIKIVGRYTIDKPLVVKTGFNIYGESMYKSKLILNKEYNEGVRAIFHFTDSKEAINYISFRDFAVTSEDYVFYRNCVDVSSGSSIQVGDFKNLYFDSIKKAIFSIKCFGFGCINFYNIYAIGDSDCSLPLFDFTNHWWNNNNIEKCRFNAKSKGLLSVVCSNTGEINRNSINGNWIELNTLSNSNDLIRMESDGVIYQFNFEENYIERNFMNDGSNINILCLNQPEGDYLIRQINISNNTFISKYKSIITTNTNIYGIIISNNIFSESPTLNINKNLLSSFEYCNNKSINYEGAASVNNNCLDKFKSVEDKVSALDATIAKFGFGYANELIKADETKIISLIPANFNKKIYYSDIIIYNTTGSFVAEGRIIQKANNSREFVITSKIGSSAESIVVNDSSGNISITNNTSNTIEVVCSSILRSL